MAAAALAPTFLLGDVRIEPAALRIEGPAGAVHVEPRVMSVLVMLANRAPQPVSREELLQTVWGGAFVTDAVLTRCISLLRHHLGDARDGPRFIETLSKHGYRVVAQVSPIEGPTVGSASASGAGLHSLAVLPFVNRSGDPADELLADGLTDLLIATLASIASLRVISRTSSMHYKRSGQSLTQIAAELKVDHVVEGSVLHAGGRVEVVVELIDAATDTQRWSSSYARELVDIIGLLNEIASAVAEGISACLTPADIARLARTPTLSRDAIAAYLRGRYCWAQRTPEALREADAAFAACTQATPHFAPGWSGRADCHVVLGLYGIDAPAVAASRAREYSERACSLDPESGEAEATRGAVRLFFDWDFTAAEAAFERALALSPSHAVTYLSYGDLRLFAGDVTDALRLIRRAAALNPLDPGLNMNVGDYLVFGRRLREGVDQFRRTLEMAPHFVPARARLAEALALLGEHAAARQEAERAVREAASPVRIQEMLTFVIAASGAMEEAMPRLLALEAARATRYVSAWELARSYAVGGLADAAIRWLRQAIAERCPMALVTRRYVAFDALRGDPRFAAMVAKLGLPALRDASSALTELSCGGARALRHAAMAAHRARGIARHAHFAPLHRERIEQQQPACKRLADAGDQLQRFRRLGRADDSDQRREHAHRGAACLLELLAFTEQAVIAGLVRLARIEHRDLAVEADRSARHERLARGERGAVHGVARGEIVGAVEHHVGRGDERMQAGAVDAFTHGLHVHVGIHGGKARLRRVDLRPSDIGGRVEDLTLEVREIDRVGIAQGHGADACRDQELGRGRTEPSGADDEHVGGGEALLRVDAELLEEHVPAVAKKRRIIHAGQDSKARGWPGNDAARTDGE